MARRNILAYAGRGSSHSWTWLADLFERHGVTDVRFAGASEFIEGLHNGAGIAIISGGDGFSIASEIGAHGFSDLKEFIRRGGTYVGMCAGAYLPLPSSIDPFNKFNLSSTKIENIDRESVLHEGTSPRTAIRYGSCAVVHPVRGEIELEVGSTYLRAPLYGGPIFAEPSSDKVVARYRGITENTEIQIDRRRIESMLVGRPAAIEAEHGNGRLLLLGPHLEHPRYPEANGFFINHLGLQINRTQSTSKADEVPDKFLERAVADLKIAILGLENRSFLVGNKLWDGSRFLELVNAIETRMDAVKQPLADEVTNSLMRVRADILKAKPQSLLYADEGPERLVQAARQVVDNHFRVLRESLNR